MAVALINNVPNARSQARLLATSKKESGAWFQALPVSSLGLRMDDETVRVAVGLRLGTLFTDHTSAATVDWKWTVLAPMASVAGGVREGTHAMQL